MRIIRKSIYRKTLFIVLLSVILMGGLYVLFDRYISLPVIPLSIIFLGSNAIVGAIIFLYFHHHIHKPLKKLHKEVNALLTGKEYKQISVNTIDELGVITHFFNTITKDLESISYDIRERKKNVIRARYSKFYPAGYSSERTFFYLYS